MTTPTTSDCGDCETVSQTSVSMSLRETEPPTSGSASLQEMEPDSINPGINFSESSQNNSELSAPLTLPHRALARKSDEPTISTINRRALARKSDKQIISTTRRHIALARKSEEPTVSTTRLRVSTKKSQPTSVTSQRDLAKKSDKLTTSTPRHRASARKPKELIISTSFDDGSPTSFSVPDSNFANRNFLNPKVVIEPLTAAEPKPYLVVPVTTSARKPQKSNEGSSLLRTILVNTPGAGILKEPPATRSKIKQSRKPTGMESISKKRKRPCGSCEQCQITEDCGECNNCKHKDVRKQKYVKRRCIQLIKKENIPMSPRKSLILQLSNQFIETCSNLAFGSHYVISDSIFSSIELDRDVDKVTVKIEDDADIVVPESASDFSKAMVNIGYPNDRWWINKKPLEVREEMDVRNSRNTNEEVMRDDNCEDNSTVNEGNNYKIVDQENEIYNNETETTVENPSEDSEAIDRRNSNTINADNISSMYEEEEMKCNSESNSSLNQANNEDNECENKNNETNSVFETTPLSPVKIEPMEVKKRNKKRNSDSKSENNSTKTRKLKLNSDQRARSKKTRNDSSRKASKGVKYEESSDGSNLGKTEDKIMNDFDDVYEPPVANESETDDYDPLVGNESETENEDENSGILDGKSAEFRKVGVRKCNGNQTKRNGRRRTKELDRQGLSNTRKDQPFSKILTCKYCHRKIQRHALDKHEKNCDKRCVAWAKSNEVQTLDAFVVKVQCPICQSWHKYNYRGIFRHYNESHQDQQDKLIEQLMDVQVSENDFDTEVCEVCQKTMKKTQLPMHIMWNHVSSEFEKAQLALKKLYQDLVTQGMPLVTKSPKHGLSIKFTKWKPAVYLDCKICEKRVFGMKIANHHFTCKGPLTTHQYRCSCGTVTLLKSKMNKHQKTCAVYINEASVKSSNATYKVSVQCKVCMNYYKYSKKLGIIRHYVKAHKSIKDEAIAQLKEEAEYIKDEVNSTGRTKECEICQIAVPIHLMALHVQWSHAEEKHKSQEILEKCYNEAVINQMPLEIATTKYGFKLHFQKHVVNSVNNSVEDPLENIPETMDGDDVEKCSENNGEMSSEKQEQPEHTDISSNQKKDLPARMKRIYFIKVQCPVCEHWINYIKDSLVDHFRKMHSLVKNRWEIIEQLKKEIQNIQDGTPTTMEEDIDEEVCDICSTTVSSGTLPLHIQFRHEKRHFGNYQYLLKKYYEEMVVGKASFISQTPEFRFKLDFVKRTDIVTILCKFCQAEVAENNLETHMINCRQRAGENSFQCKLCGNVLKHYQSFLEHQKKCKPMWAVCEYCGKDCKIKSNYYKHRKHVHGIMSKRTTPLKDYVCAVCSKVFHVPSKLRAHMRTHSDVKNYVCDICGAAYKDQSHLTKHTKEVHLGVYQYHCEKCGHGMRKKERYKTHVCGRTRKRRIKPLLKDVPDDDIKSENSSATTSPHGQTETSVTDIKPPHELNSPHITPHVMSSMSQCVDGLTATPSFVFHRLQRHSDHTYNHAAPIVSETPAVNAYPNY